MTSAYILIVALLILGGLIAALGDRIGTKVGKARLRIFNLRPKQTAIVFTVVTGIIISASTLLILFTFSKSLRLGVFQLDEILKKRRRINAELEKVSQQKEQVEKELKEAQIKTETAKKQLQNTENELKVTKDQFKQIFTQSHKLRKEVKAILQERKQLLEQKEHLYQQTQNLQKELKIQDQELYTKELEIQKQDQVLNQQEKRLQTLEKTRENLQLEINTRDEKIKELDQKISLKDEQLQERENNLINLEKELNFLQKQVEILQQYYQTYQELRERQIALLKGQVLAIALIKIVNKNDVEQAINELLRQANRTAIEQLNPKNSNVDFNQRIVQITTSQVEQLQKELLKQGEYFVRIISAGNYVEGEQQVIVFADVSPNKKIYEQGQIIANVSIDTDKVTEKDLQERLDFLISVTQFRARNSGVLGKIIIADGKIISLVNFLQQLQESSEPIQEIQAIATNTTYTSGPLQITLVVISNGEEIFRL